MGKDGGAIYMSLSDTFKKINYNYLNYEIDQLKITNCFSSTDGGGLYFNNMKNVTIKDSSIQNNKANQRGAGIYFNCPSDTTLMCETNLLLSTTVQNNIASVQGGGIYWNIIEPKNGIVEDNSAYLYGNNYAGVARSVGFYNLQADSAIQSSIIEAPTTKSGGNIDTFYLAILDKYGQIMKMDNTSRISFSVGSSVTQNSLRQLQSVKTTFQTSLSGITSFYAQQGIFNITGLSITGKPKSNLTFILNSNAIDMKIPDNAQYYKNSREYEIPVNIWVRGCISGEGMSDNGECFDCPFGFYLIDPPEIPTDCIECNSVKAICLGGEKMGPRPGYWRKNNMTANFLNCPLPTACLGMLEPNYNPIGECEQRFLGPLCSVCMPNYSRSGDYDCAKCPLKIWNVLRIIGILVLVIAVIAMMVRQNYNSANTKKIHSVYTKIFMNHMQLMVLCATFDFQWPSVVKEFFKSPTPIATSSESIISIDCFIDQRDPDTIDRYAVNAPTDEWRVAYSKIAFLVALPIFSASIIAAFWYSFLFYKRKITEFESFYMSTNVILFNTLHPTITQYMVDMFNCPNYDGDKRLYKDLQVLCYQDMHYKVAFYMALPSFLLYGIGIPAYGVVILRKYREKLDAIDTKQKFGFLYNGYKKTCYYWETVIMYRKVTMILISVVIKSFGIVVQALLVFIVLVFFLQLHNQRRPFIQRGLNDIESISLLTSMVTIYCGIFYLTAKSQDALDFDPNKDFHLDITGQMLLFSIIVLANFVFAVIWVVKFYQIIRVMIREKYPKFYICFCLCCRNDKFEKESFSFHQDLKREEILENIEEIQFFFKEMKNQYTSKIHYYGHEKFMQIVSFVQQNKNLVDMTDKKTPYKIEGKIVSQRKLEMKGDSRINYIEELEIDNDFRFTETFSQDGPNLNASRGKRTKMKPFLPGAFSDTSKLELDQSSFLESSQNQLMMSQNNLISNYSSRKSYQTQQQSEDTINDMLPESIRAREQNINDKSQIDPQGIDDFEIKDYSGDVSVVSNLKKLGQQLRNSKSPMNNYTQYARNLPVQQKQLKIEIQPLNLFKIQSENEEMPRYDMQLNQTDNQSQGQTPKLQKKVFFSQIQSPRKHKRQNKKSEGFIQKPIADASLLNQNENTSTNNPVKDQQFLNPGLLSPQKSILRKMNTQLNGLPKKSILKNRLQHQSSFLMDDNSQDQDILSQQEKLSQNLTPFDQNIQKIMRDTEAEQEEGKSMMDESIQSKPFDSSLNLVLKQFNSNSSPNEKQYIVENKELRLFSIQQDDEEEDEFQRQTELQSLKESKSQLIASNKDDLEFDISQGKEILRRDQEKLEELKRQYLSKVDHEKEENDLIRDVDEEISELSDQFNDKNDNKQDYMFNNDLELIENLYGGKAKVIGQESKLQHLKHTNLKNIIKNNYVNEDTNKLTNMLYSQDGLKKKAFDYEIQRQFKLADQRELIQDEEEIDQKVRDEYKTLRNGFFEYNGRQFIDPVFASKFGQNQQDQSDEEGFIIEETTKKQKKIKKLENDPLKKDYQEYQQEIQNQKLEQYRKQKQLQRKKSSKKQTLNNLNTILNSQNKNDTQLNDIFNSKNNNQQLNSKLMRQQKQVPAPINRKRQRQIEFIPGNVIAKESTVAQKDINNKYIDGIDLQSIKYQSLDVDIDDEIFN